ncbi:uncharacterized protein RCC_08148 [Lecanosticta acicola]|uniref:Uncharacterized protein RCC_08148 n=1 Tax=Lecanosticta acicola TaxID=111012 RepID=A0AAI8YR55_9PEZI|nr:uncharacterized protein RCC_08148 [Lecanosticta acicola]
MAITADERIEAVRTRFLQLMCRYRDTDNMYAMPLADDINLMTQCFLDLPSSGADAHRYAQLDRNMGIFGLYLAMTGYHMLETQKELESKTSDTSGPSVTSSSKPVEYAINESVHSVEAETSSNSSPEQEADAEETKGSSDFNLNIELQKQGVDEDEVGVLRRRSSNTSTRKDGILDTQGGESSSEASDNPGISQRAEDDKTQVARRLVRYPMSTRKAVQQGEERSAESRQAREPTRLKEGGEFSPEYYDRYVRHGTDRQRRRLRAYEHQKERHNYATLSDWRLVLQRLENLTPPTAESFKKKLETVRLPQGIVGVFRGNAGATILEIAQRTGSQVQVIGRRGRSVGSRDAFSALSFLGSRLENDRALAIIPDYVDMLAAEDVNASPDWSDYDVERSSKDAVGLDTSTKKGNENGLAARSIDELSTFDVEDLEDALDDITERNGEVSLPTRAVWSLDRLQARDAAQESSQSLQDKSAISVDAFVKAITRPIPALVGRKLYTKLPGTCKDHVNVTTERLVSLFSDPEVVANVPSSAVTRAITFLMKYQKSTEFREVYSSLQDGGYIFDATNLNACLAAAAKHGDLPNFRITLTTMWRQGIQPTPMTWAYFHRLMCRRFPLEAGIVLEAMRKRGLLLDNHTANAITVNMVENDLTSHLALRGSLDAFYRLYDNRFRSILRRDDFNWLVPNVAREMAKPLLAIGKPQEAWSVVEEMERRCQETAAYMHTDVLNVFLTSSMREEDFSSAIIYLRRFRVGDHGALVPDRVTYAILFTLAWRQRSWNLLRVIWRYACAAGHAPNSTVIRMWMSMLAWEPGKESSPRAAQSREDNSPPSCDNLWHAWAGKFAAGASSGLQAIPRARNPTVSKHDSHSQGLSEDATVGNMCTYAYLKPREHKMIKAASDEVMPKGSQGQQERYQWLRTMLDRDLQVVNNLVPSLGFTEMIEVAWNRDLDWKESGLGESEGYAERGNDMFKEMLLKGVDVPMEIGDFTRDARRWNVPHEMNRIDKRDGRGPDAYVPFS